MYVVVRSDLSPGLQIAQASHAAFGLFSQMPLLVERWHRDSNTLVVVSVPDEAALRHLRAISPVKSFSMIEPDLGHQMTAVALAPLPGAQRLCANLPLALRQEVPV